MLKHRISIGLRQSASRLALAAVCAGGLATGVTALAPASMSAVTPDVAAAAEGGWDSDHYWIKLTRGEIASGAASAICARYVPLKYRAQVCPPISQTTKQLIGDRNGVWAEAWPGSCAGNRYVWTSRGWAVVPNCWPPRFRYGTW